ncbi:MAG: hypothetical protein HN742_13975 [Lentisphaerae bacterium]|jgi:hypothetical protein|nr:hypothetical protein [Lentisphaerota bacterium]MBT4820587.1 hypothetical protein [Lentisphaerota bacterium]MBT5611480.1 hypothetical protein [Lentisphaerota bacterium]MBT7056342.1 hypothetical protein [Lentisphaerota bacterium]MBT7842982.1 hypothetical protein [Lentisphaerota bacterium]
MATSTFRNKNKVRPKKKGAVKRRRLLEHRRRLTALGINEDVIRQMNPKQMRKALQRPCKLAAKA